jgi:hypothetical protein
MRGAANPAAAAAIAVPAMSVPRMKGLICCAFCLARRLLAIGDESNSRMLRHCEVLIMLMALGAASAAWDVVKSIGSQVSSSSTQSTGFFGSGSDPFTTSGSDSAEPSSKKTSSSGKLSPAAMQAMLAAQGQFSMSTLNGSGASAASPTSADTSALTPISLDASNTATSSYNATGMMLERAKLMSTFEA